MRRQIDTIRYAVAVMLIAATLALAVWLANAEGPALSPPERPTQTPPALTAEPYPGPDPYPGPATPAAYPGPGSFLPWIAEGYPAP